MKPIKLSIIDVACVLVGGVSADSKPVGRELSLACEGEHQERWVMRVTEKLK